MNKIILLQTDKILGEEKGLPLVADLWFLDRNDTASVSSVRHQLCVSRIPCVSFPFVLYDGRNPAELATPRSCQNGHHGHLPGRMGR